MSIFTDNLKKLIDEHGTTYAAISRELGISKNGLKYWETAGNIPNMKILQKIADYFGTTIECLIGKIEVQAKHDDAVNEISDKNVLRLAGRDGQFVERVLSDEQLKMLRALIDQLPRAPEDL